MNRVIRNQILGQIMLLFILIVLIFAAFVTGNIIWIIASILFGILFILFGLQVIKIIKKEKYDENFILKIKAMDETRILGVKK